MNVLETVIKKIREQQEAAKDYNVKYCGAELFRILKYNPEKAELVLQELENPDMSIEKCEKKIAEYFRAHRSDASLFGPIKVISDFYGLNIDPEFTAGRMYGGADEAPAAPNRINIDDFI